MQTVVVSDEVSEANKGSFKNYVDKKGWVVSIMSAYKVNDLFYLLCLSTRTLEGRVSGQKSAKV